MKNLHGGFPLARPPARLLEVQKRWPALFFKEQVILSISMFTYVKLYHFEFFVIVLICTHPECVLTDLWGAFPHHKQGFTGNMQWTNRHLNLCDCFGPEKEILERKWKMSWISLVMRYSVRNIDLLIDISRMLHSEAFRRSFERSPRIYSNNVSWVLNITKRQHFDFDMPSFVLPRCFNRTPLKETTFTLMHFKSIIWPHIAVILDVVLEDIFRLHLHTFLDCSVLSVFHTHCWHVSTPPHGNW